MAIINQESGSGSTALKLVTDFTRDHLREMVARQKATLNNAGSRSQHLGGLGNKQKHGNRGRRQDYRQPLAFLSLPGEIRNLIYGFVIPKSRILIHSNHPNKEFNSRKNAWNPDNEPIHRPRYRLSHLLDNDDIDDEREVSPALLLTCKTINAEVNEYMYTQLTFCFDSPKVINAFLDRTPKAGLKTIKSLELHHVGYARPRNAEYRCFKAKHDRRWRATCVRIAQEMVALKSLVLNVRILDWPIQLTPADRWWRTLRLLVPNPLFDVQVNLDHPMLQGSARRRLSRAATRLENEMMSEEGKVAREAREMQLAIKLIQQAEAERRERLKKLPPVQTRSILRIVLGNQNQQ